MLHQLRKPSANVADSKSRLTPPRAPSYGSASAHDALARPRCQFARRDGGEARAHARVTRRQSHVPGPHPKSRIRIDRAPLEHSVRNLSSRTAQMRRSPYAYCPWNELGSCRSPSHRPHTCRRPDCKRRRSRARRLHAGAIRFGGSEFLRSRSLPFLGCFT